MIISTYTYIIKKIFAFRFLQINRNKLTNCSIHKLLRMPSIIKNMFHVNLYNFYTKFIQYLYKINYNDFVYFSCNSYCSYKQNTIAQWVSMFIKHFIVLHFYTYTKWDYFSTSNGYSGFAAWYLSLVLY